MMATLRWGSASHEGQLRSQNEDHAHAGGGLFVVAKGRVEYRSVPASTSGWSTRCPARSVKSRGDRARCATGCSITWPGAVCCEMGAGDIGCGETGAWI